jgi:amino acid permease
VLSGLTDWLLADLRLPEGVGRGKPDHKHVWWKVMCLTGVDYFSTLGYQPGIAFLAAGALSPIATLVLVLVTLFAALPVYCRVAQESPHGQGSIAMLERLFPGWRGKAFVLCLLGFAATDFIITITLSAADATTHIMENPLAPDFLKHKIAVTIALLIILSAIFLKGFSEAIGVAVVLVGAYLALNAIVVADAVMEVMRHPELFGKWRDALFQQHGSVWGMLGVALVLFPRLALGLSGFETGVSVMPLIEGGPDDEDLKGTIRNTRKLLSTAAVIMSIFLMTSSMATTLLIEPKQFQPGGQANGRALAYLAHRYLGESFGTAYDLSTILILAFAGASAMAGLINLIPRYLPRYGMAPEWSRASRPMVLVLLAISLVVTLMFRADVDAQGGAYATGVLVLITSASIAVTMSSWKSLLRWPFLLVAGVFVYTTAMNIQERPEGIKIASFFIALTVILSLLSRALRSTELRTSEIYLDDNARRILDSDPDGVIRLIAHRPRNGAHDDYDCIERNARECHNISPDETLIFLEIERVDASDFEGKLEVRGEQVGSHGVLRGSSPAVPNAIAALLIEIQRITGHNPHVYFAWTEGNPVAFLFRFLFLGEGDVAPITHEVLRRAIPDPGKRPLVHVT